MAKTYRRFSTEFKLGVVEAYLAGEGSLKGLATKAGVDHSLVHYWLKKYHAGELSLDLLREEASVGCKSVTVHSSRGDECTVTDYVMRP